MSGRLLRASERWLIWSFVLSASLSASCSASNISAQDDPAPTGPETAVTTPGTDPNALPTFVSLQQAIAIAMENQGRVEAAEEAIEAARQRVRQARTGTLPQIRGEIGYRGSGTSNFGGLFGPAPSRTVRDSNGNVRRQSIDTDTLNFDQGLQPLVAIDFNIYDGGFTRTSVRQARAGVERSSASLGVTQNDLAFQVTAAYVDQLRAQRVLDLRRAQEQLALEQLRSVEKRVEEGAAAEADRALPLSEYRNRQVDRILAENDVRVAANNLRNVMGLPPAAPLQLVDLREDNAPVASTEELIAISEENRPEIAEAQANLQINRASVDLARIARRPRLDTTFAFDLRPNNDLQRSNFGVGAAVSMPLWDAGLTHAREMEARANVDSAEALLEQTRKDVAADVVEARLNLVNARERVEASRLAVDAARVNVEQTTARYERGLGGTTVIDLIQAQVQFANASNSAIQALYDMYLAQAQLRRAIGLQMPQP